PPNRSVKRCASTIILFLPPLGLDLPISDSVEPLFAFRRRPHCIGHSSQEEDRTLIVWTPGFISRIFQSMLHAEVVGSHLVGGPMRERVSNERFCQGH